MLDYLKRTVSRKNPLGLYGLGKQITNITFFRTYSVSIKLFSVLGEYGHAKQRKQHEKQPDLFRQNKSKALTLIRDRFEY
jgi:hypothetical protein